VLTGDVGEEKVAAFRRCEFVCGGEEAGGEGELEGVAEEEGVEADGPDGVPAGEGGEPGQAECVDGDGAKEHGERHR